MDIKDISPSSAYHVSTVEPLFSGSHPWGHGTWDHVHQRTRTNQLCRLP